LQNFLQLSYSPENRFLLDCTASHIRFFSENPSHSKPRGKLLRRQQKQFGDRVHAHYEHRLVRLLVIATLFANVYLSRMPKSRDTASDNKNTSNQSPLEYGKRARDRRKPVQSKCNDKS